MQTDKDMAIDLSLEELIRAGLADAQRWQTDSWRSYSDASGAGLPCPAISNDAFPGYRIEREIRRGAQGVVYEATQLTTRRRVAIKLFRHSAGASSRRRFEREAEVITQIRHPNVVTMLDAGSRGNLCYLIMEFVDGRPLDAFVAAGRLSRASLLRLYASVCDAVHAAHLRGIIHRDLKPANILVDADGQPRVLDFGLAGVADPAAGAPPKRVLPADNPPDAGTCDGEFIGSLPWASPEQAAGDQARIDIRTDVYSLGVILYYLLTGSFPYDVSGTTREVLSRIASAAPVPPRIALSRSAVRTGQSPPPAASSVARRAESPRIDKDIEAILLKCLAKDPGRRYHSAGDLAREIRRYLALEPIEARRSNRWYVFRTAIRRHRVAAALLTATLLILCGAAFVSTAFWQDAESKAVTARRERDKAEQFAVFLETILEGVAPLADQGYDTTLLKRMMDDTARQICDGRLADPEAELRLRLVIGNVYLELGELTRAHELLDGALALSEQFPSDGLHRARALGASAGLAHFEGRFEESLAKRRRELEVLRCLHGADHESIAQVQFVIAECLRVLGRFDDALSAAREGLESCARLGLADAPVALRGGIQIAFTLENTGRTAEALVEFERLLPAIRRFAGNSVQACWVLTGAGTCLMQLGQPDEAVNRLREAIEVVERIYERPHIQKTRPLSSLAEALRRSGRPAEAEEFARQVISIHHANPDWEDSPHIRAQSTLARVLEDDHRLDAAIAGLREFVEFARRESRSVLQIVSEQMLARHLLRHGPACADEVAVTMRECLVRCDAALAESNRDRWMRWPAMSMLGEALVRQSQFAQAEPLLLEAYDGLLSDQHVPPPGKFDLDFRAEARRRIVSLYEMWHAAEPTAGHD
ncbi:MAG: serine/threonine protein kinase, partial [Phycisphaerales bacterium]|nr:serine/threonine protein kinase [Phycisphaerales bacterium]